MTNVPERAASTRARRVFGLRAHAVLPCRARRTDSPAMSCVQLAFPAPRWSLQHTHIAAGKEWEAEKQKATQPIRSAGTGDWQQDGQAARSRGMLEEEFSAQEGPRSHGHMP